MGMVYSNVKELEGLLNPENDQFASYYLKMANQITDIVDSIKYRQAHEQRVKEIARYNHQHLKIKEVVFDSDGVFADWTTYMLENHLTDFTDIRSFNNSDDKLTRLQAVYKEDPHAFAKLPRLPEAYTLVKFMSVLQNAGVPVRILTAVGSEHHDVEMATQDKLAWFEELFTEMKAQDDTIRLTTDLVCVVHLSEVKQHEAKQGSLLIDDYGRNCRQWAEKGGLAVKWRGDDFTAIYDLLKERNGLDLYELLA